MIINDKKQLEEHDLNEGCKIETTTKGRAESCQKLPGKIEFL